MSVAFDRRTLLIAGAAAAVGLNARPASAQAGGPPLAGADYQVLKTPQPTESGGKVEVLEFFQYSCPHCYHFAPDLERFRARRAAEVDYKRIPVVFAAVTMAHAKLYYALESLGDLERLHMKVFAAYHGDKRRLLDPKEIGDFMAANGIDRAKWEAAFNSFSVATKANRAQQVWQAYRIEGTPAVGIDGRYVTAPSMVRAQTLPGAIVVMDHLVDKVRAERGRK